MQVVHFSMACIEEGSKRDEVTKIEERSFALSIEKFRHFWWLYSSRFRLPDSMALDAWATAAFVRRALEDAQGATRADIWSERRKKKEALLRLEAAGAPIPPELREAVFPTPKFKLKTRAERLAEAEEAERRRHEGLAAGG